MKNSIPRKIPIEDSITDVVYFERLYNIVEETGESRNIKGDR